MLLDKNGKLFGKINIIDLTLLLVILLLISGVAYKFIQNERKDITNNSQLLEYQVSILNVRSFSADALDVKDNLYDAKTDTYMGKITAKEIKPYSDYITKTDGTTVLAEKPGRLEVVLTIQVPGVENPNGYLANGNRDINRQSTVNLKNELVSVQGKVTDVKRID